MNKHILTYSLTGALFLGLFGTSGYMLNSKNDTIAEVKSDLTESARKIEKLKDSNKDMQKYSNEQVKRVKRLEIKSAKLTQDLKDMRIVKKQLKDKNASLLAELKKAKFKNEESITKVKNTKTKPSNSDKGWSTFIATYYDSNFASTGKSPGHPAYGITASGEKVQSGVTIAVDPRIIPLGSWVEIQYPNGQIEKRKATDTGGAIKGNRIDIYLSKASYTSGKHAVKLRIL